MTQSSRRECLADVGRSMLVAGIGPALTSELGLFCVPAAEGPTRLNFGAQKPLVSRLQDTPAGKLPVEFAQMRPACCWRQLVALARATASEYGFPARGYDEACRLLKA